MIDQQSVERAAERFRLPEGSFEQLALRRKRGQRNRRIRAGAVGVIVALATGAILIRLSMSDGVPADPPTPKPAPAAPGTLTYSLDGDIYVADPDGSDEVKIADGRSDEDCTGRSDGRSYWAEGSMWSPDGRYLAYRYSDCSDPEFPRGVVINDAEGNVLATFPTGTGWDIGWSPDSTRVAVWDDFSSTIGIYALDGARQTRLMMPAPGTPQGDHDPVWMPDGTSVWIEGWVLPVDGSAWRLLELQGDPYPTFSPDGSLVVYNDQGSLMVARSDGSKPREVFGEPARYHAWSPTGDRIAFSDDESLRVIDVATGAVTLLMEGERGTDLRVIGFSPQGNRILFSRIEDPEDSLWSIGVDDSDARLLVAGTFQGEWLSR